jgi:hypothetical protein
MEVDRSARLTNQARLRQLSLDHGGEVRIFCAHDVVEFEMLAGQSVTNGHPAIPATA